MKLILALFILYIFTHKIFCAEWENYYHGCQKELGNLSNITRDLREELAEYKLKILNLTSELDYLKNSSCEFYDTGIEVFP